MIEDRFCIASNVHLELDSLLRKCSVEHVCSHTPMASDGMNGSPGRRQWSSRSSNGRMDQCKVCGNEFDSGQTLRGHMHRVHGEVLEQSSFGNGQYSSPSSSTLPGGDDYSSYSDSSSTYKGVRYSPEQYEWVAEIRPPKSNKTCWLGPYSSPVQAAYAYDVAITYLGIEMSLNFDGHSVYDQIPRISPNFPKQDLDHMQLRKVVNEYVKLAMLADGYKFTVKERLALKGVEEPDSKLTTHTSSPDLNTEVFGNPPGIPAGPIRFSGFGQVGFLGEILDGPGLDVDGGSDLEALDPVLAASTTRKTADGARTSSSSFPSQPWWTAKLSFGHRNNK